MSTTGTSSRRVGVAVVGLGGAVGSTAAAGLALRRVGAAGDDGLPLASWDLPADVAGYDDLVVGGWDLSGDDLATAARTHGVLDHEQLLAVADELATLKPWPAAGNARYVRAVTGDNTLVPTGLREQADGLRADLRRFRTDQHLDGVVVLNLASTESWPDLDAPVLADLDAFEAGLDADDSQITPAMLYAYAALSEGAAYGNFTPSVGGDVPALVQLAEREGLPLAGKDGKTGQTMMKTVLAPAFRSRALRVEGWYSTNILGNRDGQALDDPASNASKIKTKGSVLEACLGYEVPDHVVRIDYYRPRGDEKEAWDNVDLVGFLGQRMQVKVNFLCRDSVLAAPLALEIARLLDLGAQRQAGGVLEELGWFFKAPQTREPGAVPEHALHRQEQALRDWLDAPA